jgi:hypothetical protein
LEKEIYKRVDDEDILMSEDWLIFIDTYKILRPFYEQIIYLQLRAKTAFRGSLWEAFLLMEYLLSHIIDEKRKVSINSPILEEG